MFEKELIMLFMGSSGIFVASGFVVQIKQFEHNYLINENLNKSKIIFDLKSYKKLNIKKGKWFSFFAQENLKSKQVLQIIQKDKKVEVTINNSSNQKYINSNIQQIKYFLENKNYWENLFD